MVLVRKSLVKVCCNRASALHFSLVRIERIHRFDPDRLVFDDALVTSLIVVFKNKQSGKNHLVTFSEGDDIDNPEGASLVFPQTSLRGKTAVVDISGKLHVPTCRN